MTDPQGPARGSWVNSRAVKWTLVPLLHTVLCVYNGVAAAADAVKGVCNRVKTGLKHQDELKSNKVSSRPSRTASLSSVSSRATSVTSTTAVLPLRSYSCSEPSRSRGSLGQTVSRVTTVGGTPMIPTTERQQAADNSRNELVPQRSQHMEEQVEALIEQKLNNKWRECCASAEGSESTHKSMRRIVSSIMSAAGPLETPVRNNGNGNTTHASNRNSSNTHRCLHQITGRCKTQKGSSSLTPPLGASTTELNLTTNTRSLNPEGTCLSFLPEHERARLSANDREVEKALYEIKVADTRPIGEGASAPVYKCVWEGHEHRGWMAVKVFDMSRNDREKVHEEMDLAVRLRHDNIVRTHLGIETKTHCFLMMEMIEGAETLSSLLNRGAVTRELACKFFEQIVRVLVYLDSQGVLNQDLSSDNLLVKPDGTLRLIDFGLACKRKEFDKCIGLRGTFPYISPEVIVRWYREEDTDELPEVTPESFIAYPLAMLAYEMFTGCELPDSLTTHDVDKYAADAGDDENKSVWCAATLDLSCGKVRLKGLEDLPERLAEFLDGILHRCQRRTIQQIEVMLFD